ncbi:MAG: hypothetical protein J2P24_16585 [Streptosporangiales bacterium]|nr:hypothetical protein [Streptosporangiales bacterium]MBO0892539.1 hypothetical protein [Acidothermales bacterium]
MDIHICTREEPTSALVRDLVSRAGAPEPQAVTAVGDDWPGTVTFRGGMLCELSAPEVLADAEDVADLIGPVDIPADDLPLWLVTLSPRCADTEADWLPPLAEGIVAECGGWAFRDGARIATGPAKPHHPALPDHGRLSFVAVTAEPPPDELVGKVRTRHVLVGGPTRVVSLDQLAAYLGDEAAAFEPPLWVTELTPDPDAKSSSPLSLAVAAADFVLTSGADVFDQNGHRLPLPSTPPE